MGKSWETVADDLQTDIRLVVRYDVCGLIAAGPKEALAVARRVASEIPGARRPVSVVDCDRLVDGDVTFLMEHHLTPVSPSVPRPAVVLFREVHALSDRTQTRFSALCANRPRSVEAPRILASTSMEIGQLLDPRRFQPALLYMLNTVTLEPPSLAGASAGASGSGAEASGESPGELKLARRRG